MQVHTGAQEHANCSDRDFKFSATPLARGRQAIDFSQLKAGFVG